MKVTIHGPNLTGEASTKGYLHIHAAYCEDNRNYGPRSPFGGDDAGWTIDAKSKEEITYEVYGDQINEGSDYESCRDDLYFAPCVDLPEKVYPDQRDR